jgi:hypothetical protein
VNLNIPLIFYQFKEQGLTAVGMRCPDHATPCTIKSFTNFTDKCGRSVGMVRLRTESYGVFL